MRTAYYSKRNCVHRCKWKKVKYFTHFLWKLVMPNRGPLCVCVCVCVSVNFFLLHFRTVNVVTGRTGTTEVGTYLYVYFNNNNY